MYFRFIFLNILFFSSIFFDSCRNTQQNFKKLYFNVKADLLNPVFTDSVHGFSFCPPKGWNAVVPETLDKVKQRMEKEMVFRGSSPFNVIQIFSDSTQTNFCVLSIFTFPHEKFALHDKISFIDQQIRERFSQHPIQQGRIILDQWRVLQYRIITAHQVLFKLFFLDSSNQWIQLDYATARSSYYPTIESIESSLGSVRFAKREKGGSR